MRSVLDWGVRLKRCIGGGLVGVGSKLNLLPLAILSILSFSSIVGGAPRAMDDRRGFTGLSADLTVALTTCDVHKTLTWVAGQTNHTS